MTSNRPPKTVRIPFRVAGGRFEFLYGGMLPELMDGTTGDMLVPAEAVADDALLNLLVEEKSVQVLDAGTSLVANVSLRSVPERLKGWLIPSDRPPVEGGFVKIVLKEPLHLKLQGTKEAELGECVCVIPALGNEEAGSVNIAYSRVSTEFEPHRKSHTGNVFDKVYYRGPQDKHWRPLRAIRDKAEEEFAARFQNGSQDTGDEDASSDAPLGSRAGLTEAVVIAAQAHSRQRDKAGAAYVLHPLRLMMRMSTETERIVAVLHDVVEDTDWTLDKLHTAGFPDDVLSAVDALTRRDDESYDDFIERMKLNPVARKVKLADLEDNMDMKRISEISERDLERLRKYHRVWHSLNSGA